MNPPDYLCYRPITEVWKTHRMCRAWFSVRAMAIENGIDRRNTLSKYRQYALL
jgi:hypothetical protein